MYIVHTHTTTNHAWVCARGRGVRVRAETPRPARQDQATPGLKRESSRLQVGPPGPRMCASPTLVAPWRHPGRDLLWDRAGQHANTPLAGCRWLLFSALLSGASRREGDGYLFFDFGSADTVVAVVDPNPSIVCSCHGIHWHTSTLPVG